MDLSEVSVKDLVKELASRGYFVDSIGKEHTMSVLIKHKDCGPIGEGGIHCSEVAYTVEDSPTTVVVIGGYKYE